MQRKATSFLLRRHAGHGCSRRAHRRRKSCRSRPPVRLEGGADDRDLHLQEARRAQAPGRRRAEHPDHPDGRRRAGHALDLRRRDQHADARPGGEDGRLLQPLPLHRHVLADAGLAAHRAQPHLRRQRPDRGDRQRLRRLQRHHPEVVGDGRGGAQELRLQHRRLGQVAQHARRADHQQGAVRLLAHRLRLRVLLRLPGRRGVAVRTDADAQHHRRSSSIPRRATTSPRTSPRTPSSGCASRRPTRRTSRSSCTGRRAHRTARTR